jgi:hypothetical protein
MKCLRRILYVSRLDKMRNAIIRQRNRVTYVLDYIKKLHLKWSSHVSRSAPNNICLMNFDNKIQSRRDEGRPRRSWIDDIADNTANTIHHIYNIWHCHVFCIFTLRRETSRNKEKKNLFS